MKCNTLQAKAILLIAVFQCVAGPGSVRAQHLDVLTLQVDGHLVTGSASCANSGCTSGAWALGQRVFANEFADNFVVDRPGFSALAGGVAGMPTGATSLPANASLSWDFVPASIGGVGGNLFYWNGEDNDGVSGITPDDVAFGPPEAGYRLSLYDQANGKHSVDGANAFVAGGSLGKTKPDGSFHAHRYFQLESSGGAPADGIYLVAIQLRMSGLGSSLPIVLIFGTEHSSVAALDIAAVPWAESQLNLPGDFNRDGIVEAADFTVWRDSFYEQGSGLSADGSGNEIVDADDYEIWKSHFGAKADLRFASAGQAGSGSVTTVGPAGIPEPTTVGLFGVAATLGLLVNRRVLPARRGLGSARPPR